MRILVVDDNRSSQKLLHDFFSVSGYDVMTAGNGADALEKLSGVKVDLIISDILMPEMDGYTFCKEVKSLAPYAGIPFIFYTGSYTDEKDVSFGLSLGAEKFLFKPLALKDMLKEIQDVLSRVEGDVIPSVTPKGSREKEPAVTQAQSKERLFYKGYSERLVSKLEDKVREVEEKNKKLQELSGRVITSFEDERKRIAMDIHDEVLQLLLSVKIEIDLLAADETLAADKIREALPELSSRCSDVISGLRSLSHALYPPLLDEVGLYHYVRRLAEMFQKSENVRVDVELVGDDKNIPYTAALTVYRVLQEGFANIRKHAGAKTCRLRIESLSGKVRVELSDDGAGFNAEQARRKAETVGIFSMTERAKLAGGEFSIESREGRGTKLTLNIPY